MLQGEAGALLVCHGGEGMGSAPSLKLNLAIRPEESNRNALTPGGGFGDFLVSNC